MKHFWYSYKMALLDEGEPLPKCQVIIAGESCELEYTVCSSTTEHGCEWGDLVYLGQGLITFVPETNWDELIEDLFLKIEKAKIIAKLPNY